MNGKQEEEEHTVEEDITVDSKIKKYSGFLSSDETWSKLAEEIKMDDIIATKQSKQLKYNIKLNSI